MKAPVQNKNSSNNGNTTTINTTINTINSKQKLIKKAELIRDKILTNATITHNSYQYQIDKLSQQLQQEQRKLQEMIKLMDNRVKEIINNYHNTIKINQAGNQEQCGISVEHLKRYLNTQKNLLKLKIQSQQSNKQLSSGDTNVHKIMKSAHLQQQLELVQIAQLQKQVKFLSTHVINSSGLIYVPENVISQADEQQLNQKVILHVQQLERLIGLQVICGSVKNNERIKAKSPQQQLLQVLDEQDRRLSKVYQMLSTEKEQAYAQSNSLQKYQSLLQSMPTLNNRQNTITNNNHSHIIQIVSPTKNQISAILDTPDSMLSTQIISNQTCDHDQLVSNIRNLRNKIKKLEY